MTDRVAVLFGTETGNSQECADRLASAIRDLGVPSESIDMGHYEPKDLGSEALVFIVTSTFGNGDPPSNARDLHAYVGEGSTQLDGLRFGVCALGDSTYPLFAQCGRDFDERLAERGATRITDLVTCDGEFDFDEPFEEFKESCLAYVGVAWEGIVDGAGSNAANGVAAAAKCADVDEAADGPAPNREVDAMLSARRRLNGVASAKDTWHVEFQLGDGAPAYQPGDCFALSPRNDPDEVAQIGEWLSRYGNEPVVDHDGAVTTLEDALSRTCCLQRIPARLLELLTPHSSIARMLSERVELRGEFGGDHHVLDLLRTAPQAAITGQDLVGALRRLAPRFYSIASSQRRHPGEVHFTMDAVRMERAGREVLGVASTYAIERLPLGSCAHLTLHENDSFRLPEDDRPVLMIGPGTGVAPFRAFLQDLAERGASNRTWLFFGHRTEADDFLYADELRAFHASGRLDRLSLAWSRETEQKRYVQHALREQAEDVASWLGEGATVYLCGDARHMAPGVRRALGEVAVERLGASSAASWLEDMLGTGRLREDVY
ncbi:MAG: sulfite reductase flavoprotein subunit alpha [Planctomycetota bacterium]